MATSFNGWLGSWGDSWGPIAFDPNALSGVANMALYATGFIEGIYIAPPPQNGPSGGPSWLVGYVPSFGRKPATKRRNKRDELLFLTA